VPSLGLAALLPLAGFPFDADFVFFAAVSLAVLLASARGGISSAMVGATAFPSRWIVVQMRATALSRFSNFLTGLQSVNGATPARLFQSSTRRLAGHSAAVWLSSFSLRPRWCPR
jgi:hypothetical protein